MHSRDELRHEFLRSIGQERFPEPVPLNMKVLWKRTYLEHEEWKIEYDVESAATMPAEAGWKVPAYLLIPRGRSKPMPAMLCFHQCAEDCVVAKEVVVGKAPWVPTNNWAFFKADGRVSIDRSDQAYGYELVHEGFVVLAPDSVNCGERNIEAIRQPGENKICHQIIDPHLGMESLFKRITDCLRAVDVLQSLDFVDSQRIGAAGHSMGAGQVFLSMVFDERVKAGILGSWAGMWPRLYPLIAPRLFMGLCGEFDVEDQNQADNEYAYDYAHRCYQEANAPDNIWIWKYDCGHQFADEFKWQAYKRLKAYFGILPARELVCLKSIVEEARRVTSEGWQANFVTFPEVSGQECSITANREQVVSAIAGLILYLTDKSVEVTLRATVAPCDGQSCLEFVCTGNPPIPKERTPAQLESLRGVSQILAEYDTELQWEDRGHELSCRVVFPPGQK